MQTADCRMAIKDLLTYLENPDLGRAKVDTAIRHISACPYCEARVGYLVQALVRPTEDQLTCEACETQLPDYLQAEIEEQATAVRWQPVAHHLATCPHCAEAYEHLSGLSALAYEEKVNLANYLAPDLSFLAGTEQPTLMAEPLWQLDKWGRLIIKFSANLIRAWQPPAYNLAGLKAGESPQTLGQVAVKDAVANLEVAITVEEKRSDPTRCTLIVAVNIPNRGGWPHLANTEVILKQEQVELETQLTDPFGRAVFEEIAKDILAQLVFEIIPSAPEV